MAKLRVRQQDGTVAEIRLGKIVTAIDQEYNSESENAQSGVAVAQAIAAALENVPSGDSCDCEVDTEYSPESENAQSGKAVAQAIANLSEEMIGDISAALDELHAYAVSLTEVTAQ